MLIIVIYGFKPKAAQVHAVRKAILQGDFWFNSHSINQTLLFYLFCPELDTTSGYKIPDKSLCALNNFFEGLLIHRSLANFAPILKITGEHFFVLMFSLPSLLFHLFSSDLIGYSPIIDFCFVNLFASLILYHVLKIILASPFRKTR